MRRPSARAVAALLALVFAYYAFVIGSRGATVLRDERPAFQGLGIGLLLLSLVGVLLVLAEVRFGLGAARLARLRDEDSSAGTAPPARRTLAEADAAFPALQAAVEAAPEDWRAWYDLAVAYRDARDTRRGRAAMRRAIALERGRPA